MEICRKPQELQYRPSILRWLFIRMRSSTYRETPFWFEHGVWMPSSTQSSRRPSMFHSAASCWFGGLPRLEVPADQIGWALIGIDLGDTPREWHQKQASIKGQRGRKANPSPPPRLRHTLPVTALFFSSVPSVSTRRRMLETHSESVFDTAGLEDHRRGHSGAEDMDMEVVRPPHISSSNYLTPLLFPRLLGCWP